MLIEANKITSDQLPIGTFENFMVVICSYSKTGNGAGDGFQNPFWLVPRTNEADDVNMEAGFRVVWCLGIGRVDISNL